MVTTLNSLGQGVLFGEALGLHDLTLGILFWGLAE